MSERLIELEIISLVHGGRGLGRHDGMAVFVPQTAPGDRALCRLVSKHKRYAEAELVELLEPSVARRLPDCPLFGRCGGCQWQHLPYPDQLAWKEQIFSDLMSRAGLVTREKLAPIVSAASEWRYRSRVQFKCQLTDQGFVIGFYRRGSHSIIDVENCLLLAPPIQTTLDVLRQAFRAAPCRANIPQIDVSCDDNSHVRVVVHTLSHALDELRPWLRALASAHGFSLCLQTECKSSLEIVAGEAPLSVLVDTPGLSLSYSPGGFAQVNLEQNRRLISTMLKWLDLRGDEVVLDLFCGMGNLSLPIARRVRGVVGVEDYAPAIEDARANAAANSVNNATFRVGDATFAARQCPPGSFDLVVLDPPRTGSLTVTLELLRLAPERILYVSCDPATLARDLKPLIQSGYQIAVSQPFDFFPQTWHIESMTLLVRDPAVDTF